MDAYSEILFVFCGTGHGFEPGYCESETCVVSLFQRGNDDDDDDIIIMTRRESLDGDEAIASAAAISRGEARLFVSFCRRLCHHVRYNDHR